jgi:hypothetical protein
MYNHKNMEEVEDGDSASNLTGVKQNHGKEGLFPDFEIEPQGCWISLGLTLTLL